MNPLVGRPVAYFPAQDDPFNVAPGEALAGIVAHVDTEGRASLGVWDQRGRHHAIQGVKLYHAGDALPPQTGRYAVVRGSADLFAQPQPFAKAGTPLPADTGGGPPSDYLPNRDELEKFADHLRQLAEHVTKRVDNLSARVDALSARPPEEPARAQEEAPRPEAAEKPAEGADAGEDAEWQKVLSEAGEGANGSPPAEDAGPDRTAETEPRQKPHRHRR